MAEPEGEAAGRGGEHTAGTAKPLVLPETYSGTEDWDDWCFHFENVAAVNGWDDAQKLKWLRVRLIGRAQKALHRLPETSRTTYEVTRTALKARFDPESRQTRYQAEFQTRRKRTGEGWADFADDLKVLADKAYPSLREEAREQLTINAYLLQLTNPQVAFAVKQKQPRTVDEVVSATLEMESYLVSPGHAGIASTLQAEEELTVCPVSREDRVEKLSHAVEQLTEQVKRLQQGMGTGDQRAGVTMPALRRPFSGECWKCHRRGHMARNCSQGRLQGN